MSDPHRTTVWPALQAHDPDLVIRTLVALGFEETAAYRDEAGVVQHAQQGGFLAVAAIDADPAELHPALPRRAHDLQRQLRLRAQLPHGHRDPGPVASRRVCARI